MSEDKKLTPPLSSFARPTQAMLDFFKQRTSEHIARVVKYMDLLKGFEEGQSLSDEALTSRAKAHDKDKYSSKELILPYLWITEYYRVKNEEGEDKISPALQRQYDLADEASGKHVETNPHHPEAHENLEDMSQLDLAEMVCDWAAMAEELGEGSPKGWADKNVGTKWKFSEDQVETIYAMIKWIEEKGGSTEKIEEGENGTSLVLHKNAVYRKVGWGEDELYHTTSYGGAISILKSGEVQPKNYEGFVSFSEPLSDRIGDIEANNVTIVFKKSSIESQIEKVIYDPEWFYNHRDQAAYIAGEGWQEQWTPPEDCYDYEEDWEDEECYEEAYAEAEYNSFEYKEDEKEWVSRVEGTPVSFSIEDVLRIFVYDEKYLEYMQEAVISLGVDVEVTSTIPQHVTAGIKIGWGETTRFTLVQTCGRGNTEPECQGAEGFTIFPNYGGKSKKKKPKDKKKARSSSNFKVALSPEQKNQKKDYLLQQSLQNSRGIPSWEDVLKMIKQEAGDNFDYELEIKAEELDVDELAIEQLVQENKDAEWVDILLEEGDISYSDYPEVYTRLEEIREKVVEEEVIKDYKIRYEEFVRGLKRTLQNTECYRLIQLPKGVDPTSLDGLGIYWSLDENKVGIYFKREDLEGEEDSTIWRFSARIDLKYIDIWETVMAFLSPDLGKKEDEVRFIKYAPIYVYDAEEIIGYDRDGYGPVLYDSYGYDRGQVVNIDAWRRC